VLLSTTALLGFALGLINWLVTVLVTQNKVFEDVRSLVTRCGEWIEPRCRPIGSKVRYFASCPMCVGAWIGFAEAAAFGGPLHPHPSWASWIANGLLYKAVGHLILQVSAVLHNASERKPEAPAATPPATADNADAELEQLTSLGAAEN
jgi:hypothetical protein